MAAESFNNDCIKEHKGSIEKQKLSDKKIFLDNMLLSGIEIENEEQFNQLTVMLKNEGNIDITDMKFSSVNEGYAFALRKIVGTNKIAVFSLETLMDFTKNGPFIQCAEISNAGLSVGCLNEVSYTRSEKNKFQILLEGYNAAQGEVVGQSQQHLCDLQNDMNNDFVIQPFSQFLTNGMGSQAFHEDGHLLYRADDETNSQGLIDEELADDLPSSDIGTNNIVLVENSDEDEVIEEILEEDDLIEDSDEQNLEEEEPITEKFHTVIQGDRIWKILQNEEFGYTEKQTNLLIEQLKKNETFLSTLKSKDVDKIYPGEKITFPAEVLNSINLNDNNEEVILDENLYEVQNGDTPGKIIFDNYQGANWGNIKEIMKALEIGNVIKSGQKIDLKETIILEDGKTISKKTKS